MPAPTITVPTIGGNWTLDELETEVNEAFATQDQMILLPDLNSADIQTALCVNYNH